MLKDMAKHIKMLNCYRPYFFYTMGTTTSQEYSHKPDIPVTCNLAQSKASRSPLRWGSILEIMEEEAIKLVY